MLPDPTPKLTICPHSSSALEQTGHSQRLFSSELSFGRPLASRTTAEVMINGRMKPLLIEAGQLVKTLSIGFLSDTINRTEVLCEVPHLPITLQQPTRRSMLKSAALGSLAAIVAPHVKSTYAAGTRRRRPFGARSQ